MQEEKIIEKIDELFLSGKRRDVYSKIINNAEKIVIQKALMRSFGNQSIASRMLGINRNTLRIKIKKYGIDVSKFKI